jgi:hypothetical protein
MTSDAPMPVQRSPFAGMSLARLAVDAMFAVTYYTDVYRLATEFEVTSLNHIAMHYHYGREVVAPFENVWFIASAWTFVPLFKFGEDGWT